MANCASCGAITGGSSTGSSNRRSDRLLVLLHIFAKRTAKVPAAEISLAHQRWEDFKARMDAQPRRPPRAAGRDAP
jgi:hypothetical protein